MTTRPLSPKDLGNHTIVPYFGYIHANISTKHGIDKQRVHSFGRPFAVKILDNTGHSFTTKEAKYELLRLSGNYHLVL